MLKKRVRDEERARFVKTWLNKNPNGTLEDLKKDFHGSCPYYAM
jgi:hypothetical protein